MEAEHIVNSRTLIEVDIEPTEVEGLTPNHLLIRRSYDTAAAGHFDNNVLLGPANWRTCQHLVEHFCQKWLKEFSYSCARRARSDPTCQAPAEGDIVLIVDPSSPRYSWPQGKIKKTYTDSDNQVRLVDVETTGGVLRRPTSKIVVLVVVLSYFIVNMKLLCCTYKLHMKLCLGEGGPIRGQESQRSLRSDFLCRGGSPRNTPQGKYALSTPPYVVRPRTVKLNGKPANSIAESVMFLRGTILVSFIHKLPTRTGARMCEIGEKSAVRLQAVGFIGKLAGAWLAAGGGAGGVGAQYARAPRDAAAGRQSRFDLVRVCCICGAHRRDGRIDRRRRARAGAGAGCGRASHETETPAWCLPPPPK
ncbi:hypothetical protein EVAR_53115_1 [Eumeta japonica]|uniref:DUF5641 domain-containing protein n=1 Tax=Eumeta variegata TaxID=151549 RepID=A0A4C1Y9T2_EUMVA|nr:hypothetical protein EVAR_53115_1 [Eumeta japonica]